MAAKLQVRLTFEGGEQMKKALKEIGVEGEKGFKKIGDGAGSIKSILGGIGDAIGTVVKGFALLGGAATAAGAAILAVAKSSADAADQAGKEAQKVGVSADAYQRLAFGAKQSDVEIEELRKGLVEINKAIASTDPKKAEIFAALGINLRKANGQLRSADAVLLDLANVFARAPDGANKTAVAVELLGKSGAALVPFLNQGAAELQALGDQAARLGLVFSDEAIAQSDKFGDTLDVLTGAITGLKNAIGQALIPELSRFAELATNFIVNNREQIVAWVKQGWDFVVQVVKDLVALFQGNEAEVVNTWLITARDNLTQALTAAQNVASAVIGISDAFRTLGSIIAAPFKFAGDVGQALDQFGQRNNLKIGGIKGFATGGHIRGPGTGTSDSILARLSNGEFVVRRAVVDSLGLPFLNALNAGMVPAFAEGGAVGGGRPVTLNIGGEAFALTAADGVVKNLTRYSRQKALRSPGRSPSWVGRK